MNTKKILSAMFSLLTMCIGEAVAAALFFWVDWRLGVGYLIRFFSALAGREAIAGIFTGMDFSKMIADIRSAELNLPLKSVCPQCRAVFPQARQRCEFCDVQTILTRDYNQPDK